jgi:hypothetical protein
MRMSVCMCGCVCVCVYVCGCVRCVYVCPNGFSHHNQLILSVSLSVHEMVAICGIQQTLAVKTTKWYWTKLCNAQQAQPLPCTDPSPTRSHMRGACLGASVSSTALQIVDVCLRLSYQEHNHPRGCYE